MRELPSNEVAKVDGRAGLRDRLGRLGVHVDLYNGFSWVVTDAFVLITIRDTNGRLVSRRYRLRGWGPPIPNSRLWEYVTPCEAELGLTEIKELSSWQIVSAEGYPATPRKPN